MLLGKCLEKVALPAGDPGQGSWQPQDLQVTIELDLTPQPRLALKTADGASPASAPGIW